MAQDIVPWWALALTELNYLVLLPASELASLLVKCNDDHKNSGKG
jgi:hypothetical protein